MITEKAIFIRRFSCITMGVIILAEIAYLYKDIFIWVKRAWFGYPPDKFGLFVPIIFLVIVTYRFVKSHTMAVESDYKGLIIILFSILVFLTGYAADIHIIQAVSLIFMGFGIVIFMMGTDWGRVTLFPFAFLLLMMPTISFLLESMLGIFFRIMVTFLSGFVLNILGGPWDMGNGTLFINKIDFPIQYYRDSISSPLALLIFTCVVVEFLFTKNRYKFLSIILLWIPLFIIAHSIFTTTMGWTFEHDYIKLSELIWDCRRWIPAMYFIVFLISIGIMLKLFGSKWILKIQVLKV